MFHLQQTAGVLVSHGIAAHQASGNFARGRQFFSRLYKRALQVLIAQIYYGSERG